MKNVSSFILPFVAVVAMLYAGVDGLLHHREHGPFFMFVGSLFAIGLAFDIVGHLLTGKLKPIKIRLWFRRNGEQ